MLTKVCVCEEEHAGPTRRGKSVAINSGRSIIQRPSGVKPRLQPGWDDGHQVSGMNIAYRTINNRVATVLPIGGANCNDWVRRTRRRSSVLYSV